MWQSLVVGFLTRMIRVGTFDLTLPDVKTMCFDDGSEPKACLVMRDPRAFGRIRRSPVWISRRNVEAHYDIPTEFYAMFMEPGR